MPEPIKVGVLYDFPQGDGGAFFEAALHLGLADSDGGTGIDRAVELVTHHAAGLPSGTIAAVERGFAELVAADVLAIVGPSISDNGLVARGLADRAGVAAINYTGGERTRSEWMFHYQVGSLAEEPIVLAEHVAALGGIERVVAVRDRSPVGRGYLDALEPACERLGLELAGVAAVAPGEGDLSQPLRRLRSAEPGALIYLGLGVAARSVAVALAAIEWEPVVVANSALMFGYGQREWRAGWNEWVYVDTVSDHNQVRGALQARSPHTAAGPIGVAAYDIGRLLGAALATTAHLTRDGVRDALESVKRLPAASGKPGTTMGFGVYDHGALKGEYLVKRVWRDGKSVEWA